MKINPDIHMMISGIAGPLIRDMGNNDIKIICKLE